MKFEPRRHQALALQFARAHPRAGLFLDMGLGKTVVALTLLTERLWDEFTVRRCLVVAPLNVARNVWAQEAEKWDHTKALRVSLILGNAKQRRAAVRANAELYVINRENLLWLEQELGGAMPFDMIVVDELSSFKSNRSKRWKALARMSKEVPYVLGLTGTPAANGYEDLWAEVFLLDRGKRLGRKITDYRLRFFSPGAHKGHVVYQWRLRPGAKATIDRKLADLCLSMQASDWLDLPETIFNEIPVEMTSKARKLYDTLKDDKVIPLLRSGSGVQVLGAADDLGQMTNVIDGATAASVANKLLQMANGAVYDDEGGVVHIHDEKLDALGELIEAHSGENILVFYSYQHDRDRILARFPQAVQFRGPAEAERWNAGEIPLLLCHPASASHGLNLQFGGHVTVWFGLTKSLELYQQANARLRRPGQTKTCIVHHLICRGTLDQRVMAALREKDKTQEGLLKALKGYLGER